MSQNLEEQDARVLGTLLRGESPALDAPVSEPGERLALDGPARTQEEKYWLQKTATDLMAVVDSASRHSTFPLFRDAERIGRRQAIGAKSWAAVLAVAAGAFLAFAWSMNNEGPSLTFVVEGAATPSSESQEVGRVRAPAHQVRTLRFSDGSTLTLEEGGSVRVRETDENGAEVVIENGSLASTVTPREGTSWSVFAGPYEIEVNGTRFSTNWDPMSQRLVVLLDEGFVRVVGSNIEDHVALKPGQRFEAAPNEAWKVTAQEPAIELPAPVVEAREEPEKPRAQ